MYAVRGIFLTYVLHIPVDDGGALALNWTAIAGIFLSESWTQTGHPSIPAGVSVARPLDPCQMHTEP